MKKLAIVLAGCGHKDGSEIRESVAVLWALSAEKIDASIFAPDLPQVDVVNHLHGETVVGEKRNMLTEAARIARGKIRALQSLDMKDFDGIILPGGYGAAKNLCTFATEGAKGKVLPDLKKILETAHSMRKPIGAVCIAPAIVALSFPGRGIELTIGQPGEASQEIEKLGHKHRACAANGCHVDPSFRVVSTPAYMYENASLSEIFMGIHKLVKEISNLLPKG